MSCRLAPSVVAWLVLTLGCQPELGECNPEGAFELVYTEDGVPAFAGQALINQSCGGGGFCHASGIPDADRHGVPRGLELDLRLASTTEAPRDAETARLSRDQIRAHAQRHAIWAQVESGRMPPPDVGADVLESIAVRYDRVGEDGSTFSPLPGLDTEQGRDIVRNWLACGTPVVERTVPRSDGAPSVGFVVPACRRRCIDPTWPALREALIVPGCATAACHDAEAPAAALDLTGEAIALRERLVEQRPAGALCGAGDFAEMPMLTPGEPEASLLWLKVAPLSPAERCGSAMPLSGAALSEQSLCALREWIAAGACADPTDSACAEDLEGMRARCGVELDESGAPSCAVPATCAPGFDPERG
jgi:hypothetical protein